LKVRTPKSAVAFTRDGVDSIFPSDFGFGVRRGVFYPLLGDGIFTQEGAAWKHSRELLRKQFARTQYQKSDHFREHVENLLACLPKEKGVVDLQPLFFRLTLDTTTALLFGKSVHSLRAEDIADAEDKAFAEGFNTAQEGLAKRFRIAPWHFLYSPSKFNHACSTVHQFVDNYIEQRDSKTESNGDQESSFGFIDQVALESSNDTMLRDQLINVLLAGRDTTACCLSWTMYVFPPHILRYTFLD
jgi:cytochrome P450